jgi:hypothetical protein
MNYRPAARARRRRDRIAVLFAVASLAANGISRHFAAAPNFEIGAKRTLRAHHGRVDPKRLTRTDFGCPVQGRQTPP